MDKTHCRYARVDSADPSRGQLSPVPKWRAWKQLTTVQREVTEKEGAICWSLEVINYLASTESEQSQTSDDELAF